MPNVMAAQPNIGGALCKSSVIPFLVPCYKVWLMAAARVPCSNDANTGEHKTWAKSEFCSWQNSIRGQDPPKMYTVYQQRKQPKIKQFCWPPVCDVAAVMKPKRESRWNLLGCPKLANGSQSLVDRSSPYCGDMWRRYWCLTSIFSPTVNTCLSREDIAGQSCGMVPRWRFFESCIFSEPRAAHFRQAFKIRTKAKSCVELW